MLLRYRQYHIIQVCLDTQFLTDQVSKYSVANFLFYFDILVIRNNQYFSTDNLFRVAIQSATKY